MATFTEQERRLRQRVQRLLKKHSQTELARASGLSQSHVSDWVRGKANAGAATLDKIESGCRKLGDRT